MVLFLVPFITKSDYFEILDFIYLFIAAQVFVAAYGLSQVAARGGYSLVVVCRLLSTVTSLIGAHRL